jgi:DnaK suppressor protein
MKDEAHKALVKRFRPRLETERLELDKLLKEQAGNSAPVELDQQSVGRLTRMDAMQVQALAQEVRRRRVHRRHQVDRALRRMDDGDYGYCSECGEEIGVGRLGVDPTFATCVRCAR